MGHDLRDQLLRRLASYEQLRNEMKDGNPVKILIDDAMDSLRRELVQHDARSIQEMVQKLRRRGRPPQKPLRPGSGAKLGSANLLTLQVH